MKHFRRSCATIILTLVVAISASAGEMGTPGSNTPPPPLPVPVETGEMGTPGRPASDSSGEASDAPDLLTEAAILFCKSLLSLF